MDSETRIPLNQATRQRLLDLHRGLLRLHKSLLDDERAAYEKINGPVGGAGRVLELVMNDPWFDWLRRISEIIVEIDQVTDSEESTIDEAHGIIQKLRNLFKPQGAETPFMARYKAVLQRNPEAVLGHIEVQKLLLLD